jgi:hypothetical protein
MLSKLRRLNDFSPGEILILLQFIALALVARLALIYLRLSRLVEFIDCCTKQRSFRSLPLSQNRYEITRLTRLADIGARVIRADGPCLLRSLLLFWLLKVRRQPAELVIGVSKEASALNSHAWIESEGKVIGDSVAMTESFATLVRF